MYIAALSAVAVILFALSASEHAHSKKRQMTLFSFFSVFVRDDKIN